MKTLIVLAVLVAITMTDSCGGNCPSGKCPTCYCGTTKNMQDITTWCAKDSAWNQSCCKCIVSHESSGNANAMNYNSNASTDVGLWQINQVGLYTISDQLVWLQRRKSSMRPNSQSQLRQKDLCCCRQHLEAMVNPHNLRLLIIHKT